MDARIQGQSGAASQTRLLAPGLETLARWRPADPERAGLDVTLVARDVPTALVSAFADAGGLLEDVLGPSLQVELVAEGYDLDRGALRADLSSALAQAKLHGRIEEGLLVSDPEQPSDLRFALTTPALDGLVGQLLPFAVKLAPSDPDQWASLSFQSFALPMDGDLSKPVSYTHLTLPTIYSV